VVAWIAVAERVYAAQLAIIVKVVCARQLFKGFTLLPTEVFARSTGYSTTGTGTAGTGASGATTASPASCTVGAAGYGGTSSSGASGSTQCSQILSKQLMPTRTAIAMFVQQGQVSLSRAVCTH